MPQLTGQRALDQLCDLSQFTDFWSVRTAVGVLGLVVIIFLVIVLFFKRRRLKTCRNRKRQKKSKLAQAGGVPEPDSGRQECVELESLKSMGNCDDSDLGSDRESLKSAVGRGPDWREDSSGYGQSDCGQSMESRSIF